MNRITTYLRRIRYHGTPRADFTTLYDLQRLHLHAVPYENLDIMRGVPLSLTIEDLYDKIVLCRRGGYCFELNALFAWLLRSLGFAVTDCMARFLRDETQIPMRRHRVLMVACAGSEYLCDVGVGGVVPRKPLPLTIGKVSEQNGEKYILEKDDFLGTVLLEWRYDSWRKVYAFTHEPQLEQDFTAISYYCEAHPDSFFKTQDMIHIFTEDGRKSVAGREVRIFNADGVKVHKPVTEAAYHELLKIHFGIVLV
ncbi:MAG: arylamine N-acetyltransferase [Defluviitaleaceae bacterium]|nr:arylamine N-acetyltransferase [Defluviitaleaceae bacterium]